MAKKFLILKKAIIFDGDQELLFAKKFEIECSLCSNVFVVQASSCQHISNLPQDIVGFIVSKIKGIKKISLGESDFYTIDNLSLKYLNVRCDSCEFECIVLFALGESQSARFAFRAIAAFSV